MPIYNKLVRDYIPQIIEQSGKRYTTSNLTIDEYKKELKKKAEEEWGEYIEAKTEHEAVEELADLLEVVYALAALNGATPQQLEHVRQQKADEKGGFNERVFLVEVEDQ
ncbi:nucleoside triphosphate pyrophosphohydrolase [Priestia flexa]|uniref:nucleoside triphosphate pyrophosphohydrolase n=1 Tax=Priestia flexa TaxID=86664 RepID=UPI000956E239|nr:nucleoside triphosphate pyrophosphohydrolase [Priestia flexa]SIR23863.1 Predicted house-cleaning noncanonical NTP pyrophosphatase, all-alpha NTP-PPase (MazG) superfamily [Priestia flexa]